MKPCPNRGTHFVVEYIYKRETKIFFNNVTKDQDLSSDSRRIISSIKKFKVISQSDPAPNFFNVGEKGG
jgi:hypothetical protein